MIIILRSFLRSLVRRRALTLIQIAGVACGVAAVVGMVLASNAAIDSFSKAVRFLNGQATHALSRPVGPMPDSVLTDLMDRPEVAAFAPVLDRQLGLEDGTSVRVLGLEPFLDNELRPDLVFAAEVRSVSGDEAFLDFLLETDTVIVERYLAGRLGLGPGDVLKTAAGPFRVLGVFTHPAAEPIVLMDIAQAQELYSARGFIDRVDLILGEPDAFTGEWNSRGYQVSSQNDRQGVFTDMLRAFRLNLEALSLLALLVGVFLVYNTSMFRVISRRRNVGILRSLGAGQVEIAAAVMIEVVLLGILGGAAGGVLGFGLARVLTGVVGETVSRLYFFLRPLPPEWSWTILAAGAVLGLLSSLLGGIFPLITLVREDPVAALRGHAPRLGQARAAGWAAGAGLGLVLFSLWLLNGSQGIVTAYVGAFGVILGLSFMCGLLLLVMAAPWKAALRAAAGPVGSLAAGNVRRSLGRTAVAVAAFGVALSLLVGLGSMIGSFRQTLIWWMEGQIRADFYLQAPAGREVPLSLYDRLSRLEGVGGVDPYNNVTIRFGGSIVRIAAIDPHVLGRFGKFAWYDGDDGAWEKVKEGGTIVSESFTRRFGRGKGSTISLTGPGGEERFAIGGVFYDYTTEHGLIMMSRETFIGLFGDPSIDTLAVFLEPEGVRPPGTADRVRVLARKSGLVANEREGFRERILSIFDATFTVTQSMRALAVIVAFFGITGALLTLFMERRREFGIYRALGMTGREVAFMTLLEGVGMGIAGFLLSTVAGTMISFILIRVINVQSFNWTIFYHFSVAPYLTSAAIAVTASVGAALYPVVRVVRTYPKLQIREE